MKLSVAITTPEILCFLPVALFSGTFEEKLDKARQYGYDGVELLIADPKKVKAAEIKHQIENSGLEISAVSTGAIRTVEKWTIFSSDTDVMKKAEQRFFEIVEIACQLEAPVITVGAFRGWTRPYDIEEVRKHFLEMLERIAEKCKQVRGSNRSGTT